MDNGTRDLHSCSLFLFEQFLDSAQPDDLAVRGWAIVNQAGPPKRTCVMAFHEKAGRSQVGSFVFSLDKLFLFCRVSRCRHPSIRTLDERLSLGASWAFSFQPALPPDYRPALLLDQRRWARPLTQSPELGVLDFVFPFSECFCFTPLPAWPCGRCCATVRTPLRSPTGDAATPRAFWRWR